VIESFLGISIAVAISISLITTIAFADKSIKNLGREPLSLEERRMLEKAGYTDDEIKIFDAYIKRINLEF
tara:strand:+ start:637 stop:846 length:210 start_codon:yes stop_codon:yes gene_type:complete